MTNEYIDKKEKNENKVYEPIQVILSLSLKSQMQTDSNDVQKNLGESLFGTNW